MLILSVESTCDETAVAVTENGRKVLTDQIFSQADLHAVYGGVVPEIASRSHVEVISRLADRAIAAAGVKKSELDAVAVSYAPGLIGAVLVGVNFAKSAAAALGIDTVLTSGGAESCRKGISQLAALLRLRDELNGPEVLIGAGVNAAVIDELRAALPGARAFHASCKTLLESGMTFRREGVPMGLPGLDEWHIQQTDADAVCAAKAAVMR